MKEIEKQIAELETQMANPGFWNDKQKAQEVIQKFNDLKAEMAGEGKYDKLNAIITIFSGAGGLDSEDFSRMLLQMYLKFIDNKNWTYTIIHQNQNDHGGYRNITLEIEGKGSYGILKNESGVHRLVRLSPFNAKQQRHTSFSMVEVVPKFKEVSPDDIDLKEDDLEVQFSRSSGPGGQNVNKRDTAVRITHVPTNISVHVDTERSQGQNREKALEILKGKLYHRIEEERKKKEAGLAISSSTEIEWGNQMRSYVLHPYQMVKDHRTGVEVKQIDKVLEDGELDEFIEAEKSL
jgi:peptide chain release factor 2